MLLLFQNLATLEDKSVFLFVFLIPLSVVCQLNRYSEANTLFIDGTGRTDFQGGSSSDTFDSVTKKIYNFPNDTIVFPGHNYNGLTMSTIGEEKKSNPNVGLHIKKEDFILNESKKERPYPKRFDVAVPANMKCGKK